MHYDAIIIGAGNGGLSTATQLAVHGKKVLVLEKHNIPGGCGTSFRRGRFEFEVALHQLSQLGTKENPGELMGIFKEYGIYDKLEFIPIESLYKVVLPTGLEQALPPNRKGAEEALIKTFPAEKEGILKYYEIVYNFSAESEKFAAMSAKSTKEPSTAKKIITKAMFPKLFPTLAKYGLCTSQEVMDELFISEELKNCVSVYWCFMGMKPDNFPFSILARCTALYIDYLPYYVKGGSQMISQALADRIRECGSEIKYSCGAKEILVVNGKATGVIDEDGVEYTCDTVISGISPVDTYFKLIKEENIPESAKEYLAPYTVGISALTCFIGLDCPPETVGFTDSFNLIYEEMDCNKAFQNSYKITPDTDPLVTTCYTVDDPSVSPKGTSVITAGTLKYGKAWMELSPDEYYDQKYKAADIIIERLEKRFPGFRSHIEEIEVATPLTHMRYLGHPEGSIYGFQQDMTSSVFFFPTEDQIENLTFSNGWVNICGFGPNYIYGYKIGNKILSKEVK